jgi:hypothetical protein
VCEKAQVPHRLSAQSRHNGETRRSEKDHRSRTTLDAQPETEWSRTPAPAWQTPFHGASRLALFSSQIATHGKSFRLKQYPTTKLSLLFVAATNAKSLRGSISTVATKPRPGRRNGRRKSILSPPFPGAYGQRKSREDSSSSCPSYPWEKRAALGRRDCDAAFTWVEKRRPERYVLRPVKEVVRPPIVRHSLSKVGDRLPAPNLDLAVEAQAGYRESDGEPQTHTVVIRSAGSLAPARARSLAVNRQPLQ